MALIKRLAMRRKIRETSEEALSVNPPLPTAEQPAPASPTSRPLPAPETPLPRTSDEPSAAEALLPDIAEPGAHLYHAAPPEVDVARLYAESSKQELLAADTAAPDRGPEGEMNSAPGASADPAVSSPADGWQLPQWQYTTKRARLNQRQQRK